MKKTKVVDYRFGSGLALFTGILFFLVSFRAPDILSNAPTYAVPGTIEMIQQYSLIIVVVGIFLMSIWWYSKFERFSLRSVSHGIVYYLIFRQILVLTDFYYQTDVQAFIIDFAFNFALFFYFGFIIKGLKFYSSSGRSFLHIAFWGIVAFIALNAALHLAGMGSMIWNRRFFGLTANPNFIGMASGVCVVFSFALLSERQTFWHKLLCLIGFVSGALVCFMSDSRGAMGAALAGCLLITVLSAKRAITGIVIVFLIGSAAFFLLSLVDINSIIFAHRGNTREQVWEYLYVVARGLPFFGLGSNLPATTNSYLYAIAATGLLGGFFFFMSLIYVFRRSVSIVPLLKSSRINPIPIKIYIGLSTFLIGGALFEGFMLDSASIPVFTYWFLLAYGK